MSLLLRAVNPHDRGLRRDTNEDAAYAGPRLIVLADGRRGLPAGEIASQIAVRELSTLDVRSRPAGPPWTPLRAAVAAASQGISDAIAEDPALEAWVPR